MVIKTVKTAMFNVPESIMTLFDRYFHSDDLVFEVDILDEPDFMERYDFIFLYGALREGDRVICIVEEGESCRSECFDVWVNNDTLEMRIRHFAKMLHDRYALVYTKNLLETTVDTSGDLIWHKSLNGIHTMVNNAFCEAVGKKKEDVVGKDHYDVWSVPRPKNVDDEYICVTSEDIVFEKRKYCMFDEDVKIRNSIHKFYTGKSPIFNLDGTIIGSVGVGKDVTDDDKHKHSLMMLAMTDALTGTYNRNYIYKQVIPNEKIYDLAFIDINYFKDVNDHLGHAIGDRVLCSVSEAITRFAGSSDVVARWGGDEFLILRLSPTPLDDFEFEIQILMKKLNDVISDLTLNVGASISVGVTANRGDEDFAAMMKRADERMYVMKEQIHIIHETKDL